MHTSDATHAPGAPGPEATMRPAYRQVALSQRDVAWHEDAHGDLHLEAVQPLQTLPVRLLDRLVHWAQHRPDHTFAAKRGADGQWRRISYAQMLANVRTIAAHLLDYNLSAERPLLILSGNDLEHLQLAYAAMYAGIPHAPIAPAYSLLSSDYAKLRHVVDLLTPGLLFCDDGHAYRRAIDAVVDPSVPLIATRNALPERGNLGFDALLAPRDTIAADAAFAATNGDTIAKFLFTSGSTKLPKAVITTQRMLCANQQMLLQTFPVLGEDPVLVDWLPWNHTFGGSHNLGIALYNGGTFYIDDGKPTAQHFGETLRNLRELSPTVYLSVPRAWEQLADALEADASLRDSFLANMKMFFFAAAALSQDTWDRLEAITEAHCGERIRMLAGLGMTECAPSCTFTSGTSNLTGDIGIPAPGCEVRLVPTDGKLEMRFRGPHVMPGYWRAPEQTAAAFDEEGFYRSGDAVKLLDPEDPAQGLLFDGRLAEDFKLSSGVFVSVGPLRTRIILEGAPCVQDVVMTAPSRPDIGMLIFPVFERLRALSGLPADAAIEDVVASPAVVAWLQTLLQQVNRDATGNSTTIVRACILTSPPSGDRAEITDKGSINQRAVLAAREAVVDALYRAPATIPGALAPEA